MSFFKNASILFLLHSLPYIYKGKDYNKSVNIFRKNNYRITPLYQRTTKPIVLHSQSVGFAR